MFWLLVIGWYKSVDMLWEVDFKDVIKFVVLIEDVICSEIFLF